MGSWISKLMVIENDDALTMVPLMMMLMLMMRMRMRMASSLFLWDFQLVVLSRILIESLQSLIH